MRRVRLVEQKISDFGSRGVSASAHARVGAVQGVGVDVLRFAPGAVLGRHPTRLWQLFSVLQGAGWAAGGDGVRVPLSTGDCVMWEPDEDHASGTDDGMLVVVVQTPMPPLPDVR